MEQPGQSAGAGPHRLGVLLKGHGQPGDIEHRLAQVMQASIPSGRHGHLEHRRALLAKLQHQQVVQGITQCRIRTITQRHSPDDQLAQQFADLEHFQLKPHAHGQFCA
ncbi:hypothetical protein D9M68_986960 [compost metagenome]